MVVDFSKKWAINMRGCITFSSMYLEKVNNPTTDTLPLLSVETYKQCSQTQPLLGSCVRWEKSLVAPKNKRR